MKLTQTPLGIGILTFGIFLLAPGARATDPSEVEANGDATGDLSFLMKALGLACPFRLGILALAPSPRRLLEEHRRAN